VGQRVNTLPSVIPRSAITYSSALQEVVGAGKYKAAGRNTLGMKMGDTANSESTSLQNAMDLENSNNPSDISPSRQKQRRRVSPVRSVFQFAALFVLAYGSYLALSHYVLQSVEVVGNSMTPTLQNAEHCLLNRWVYLVREPQASDIVVLRDPTDKSYAVKRIIASEGDTVYLKDGKVFVNDRLLKEPYLPAGTVTYSSPDKTEQRIVCGKGQYIVLGDNRNNSLDSRVYGTVPRQDILGVIMH